MSRLELFDDWDLDWLELDDLDEPLLADGSLDEEELSGHESAASS